MGYYLLPLFKPVFFQPTISDNYLLFINNTEKKILISPLLNKTKRATIKKNKCLLSAKTKCMITSVEQAVWDI